MKPPELRPNSAGALSDTTWNSLIASRLTVKAGRCPPRCSPKNGLLLSAPSIETLLLMPFWPLIEISSPSGPCTMETPGVSGTRLRKLRPLLGRSCTDRWSRYVELSTRPVSRIGASAVTETTCSTCEMLSVRVSEIVWPTARSSPSRTSVPKFGGLDRDLVRPQRQQQPAEPALGIGGQSAGEVGAEVGDGDLGARDGAAGGIVHDSFDGAGVGLGLGEDQTLQREDRQKANEHEPVTTHDDISP